jgi:hypothetical protein
LFPLFATCVIATGVVGTGFAANIVDTCDKLPPVTTTLAKLVAKFAADVVDTSGKFAAGVVVPVEHLDLRISPRIFEKIQNGPNGILWGWV